MKVRLLFRWYDLWVGVFIDTKGRKVYIFPVPMFGVCLEFASSDKTAYTIDTSE